MHAKVPLYDIASITTGKPQIGRVIHLTFFSQESAPGGTFFDVSRVVLRGTTLLASRSFAPTAAVAAAPEAAGVNLANREAAGPGAAVAARVAATSADAVHAWDARIDQFVRGRELAVVGRDDDTLAGGRTHERLQQMHQGVPVFGGDLTRQAHAGRTVSIFGTVYQDIAVDTSPRIPPDAARRSALGCAVGEEAVTSTPTLGVLPLDDGGYALAWQAQVRTGHDVRTCFVSASSGEVLLDYRELKTQRPESPQAVVYDLRGRIDRAAAVLAGSVRLGPSDTVTDALASGDPVAAAALAAANATAAFYRQRFGRQGIDGRGAAVPVIVHPAAREDWPSLGARYGIFFAGGFWDGQAMVLGDGLPPGARAAGHSWAAAASALDVVAHEYAHGVLDHSSRLVYRGEPGALAEAFADVMAVSVEASAQPEGAGAGRADYLIGEDAVGGRGLRSVADPSSHGHPDHVSGAVRTADDNGGVHVNSTIVSHAFYLAVEGGVNRTSGLAVQGVGRDRRDQVERAFYRAFVYLLPSMADFGTARAATIQSARDLYGAGSLVERAIAQAWDAVGVAR